MATNVLATGNKNSNITSVFYEFSCNNCKKERGRREFGFLPFVLFCFEISLDQESGKEPGYLDPYLFVEFIIKVILVWEELWAQRRDNSVLAES